VDLKFASGLSMSRLKKSLLSLKL